MARAQGARAQMALAFETTYGTPPVGGFTKMPFASTSLGAEQPLLLPVVSRFLPFSLPFGERFRFFWPLPLLLPPPFGIFALWRQRRSNSRSSLLRPVCVFLLFSASKAAAGSPRKPTAGGRRFRAYARPAPASAGQEERISCYS